MGYLWSLKIQGSTSRANSDASIPEEIETHLWKISIIFLATKIIRNHHVSWLPSYIPYICWYNNPHACQEHPPSLWVFLVYWPEMQSPVRSPTAAGTCATCQGVWAPNLWLWNESIQDITRHINAILFSPKPNRIQNLLRYQIYTLKYGAFQSCIREINMDQGKTWARIDSCGLREPCLRPELRRPWLELPPRAND